MVVPTQVSGFAPKVPTGTDVRSIAIRGTKIAVKAGIAGFILLAAHNAIKPMLPEMANKIIDVLKPAAIGAATGDPIAIGAGALVTGERLVSAVAGYAPDAVKKPLTGTKISGLFSGQESF